VGVEGGRARWVGRWRGGGGGHYNTKVTGASEKKKFALQSGFFFPNIGCWYLSGVFFIVPKCSDYTAAESATNFGPLGR
jgi:hypothetical protein